MNRPFINFGLIFIKLNELSRAIAVWKILKALKRTSCIHILYAYILNFSTNFILLSLSLKSEVTKMIVLSLLYLASRQRTLFSKVE